MQGKKNYKEKLFVSFQFSDHVPKNNFYRRLKDVLDLDQLYSSTDRYYGACGQKSIDPVVFFKLCLVGYLENICNTPQFLGFRKINTRGLAQANKVMHMAAIAYNLKKYLNYSQKRAIVVAKFKATAQIAIKRSQAMFTTVLASVKVDGVLNQWEVQR